MSIERKTFTKLWCDMDDCLSELQWPFYLSRKFAEKAARGGGWRKDRLGRNICPFHPKLKGARDAG